MGRTTQEFNKGEGRVSSILIDKSINKCYKGL
jgi:hypothetical protein